MILLNIYRETMVFLSGFLLLLIWHAAQSISTIIHSEQVNVANSTSFRYLLLNSTSGLNMLVSFVEKHNVENATTFLDKRYNSILSVYSTEQEFQQFSIDEPVVRENAFHENNAYFPYQYDHIVQTITRVNPKKLSIVSLISCTDKVIISLLKDFERMGSTSFCNSFNPYDQDEMSLWELLRHFVVWDYTHLLLLLSRTYTNMVVDELIRMSPLKRITVYTVSSWTSGQVFPATISNIMSQGKPLQSIYLEESILKDLEQLHYTNIKKYSIRDRINRKLRRELEISSSPQKTLKLQAYQDALHFRGVTIDSLPYNTILRDKPNAYGKCLMGHQCIVPRVLVNKSTVWDSRCCDGIAVSLFNMIAEEIDFKYSLYVAKDGLYGGLSNNNTWTGIIGELVNNRADVGVQGFTPNVRRMNVVDFSPSFMHDFVGFVLHKDKPEAFTFINWEFVKSMEDELAVFVLLSTVFSALFIIISENIGFFVRGKKYFSTRDAMTYIFGLAFQRDMGGRNPVRWSGRLAALCYAAAMTVVMTTYTAHLTAKNIQNNDSNDFKGFKDSRFRNPTPDFTFGTIPDTSTEMRLKHSRRADDYRIYEFMKNYNVETNQAGAEKVYRKELDAFFTDMNGVQLLLSRPRYCNELWMHIENSTESEISFSYRKDFSLADRLAKTVRKLRELGEVHHLTEKWAPTHKCLSTRVEFSQFDINYFGGIVLICVILFCVSIILIFLENLWTYVKVKRGIAAEVKDNESSSCNRIGTVERNLFSPKSRMNRCKGNDRRWSTEKTTESLN